MALLLWGNLAEVSLGKGCSTIVYTVILERVITHLGQRFDDISFYGPTVSQLFPPLWFPAKIRYRGARKERLR